MKGNVIQKWGWQHISIFIIITHEPFNSLSLRATWLTCDLSYKLLIKYTQVHLSQSCNLSTVLQVVMCSLLAIMICNKLWFNAITESKQLVHCKKICDFGIFIIDVLLLVLAFSGNRSCTNYLYWVVHKPGCRFFYPRNLSVR